MPRKKIVQDIVPAERKSIRNIPIEHEIDLPIKKIRKKVTKLEKEIEEISEPKVSEKRTSKKENKSKTKYILSFIVVFICIAVIGLALSLSYSKATVTITPKVLNFNINGTFTAKKSAINDELGYDMITVSDEVHEEVSATSGPSILTKAKGTVIIYNNYSATSQILVAGTRLSNANGLIYRTTTTVSIPGKKTTPGSASVAIIADQAGADYNINVTDLKGDFKLIGYKGTSKYDGFYARLKTNITGGFLGTKMIINPDIQKSTILSLQNLLKDKVIAKLKSSVPTGYMLYDSAISVEFATSAPTMNNTNKADIAVKAVAYGAIFKIDSLIKYIAGNEIKKFPSDTYNIKGPKELDFKVSNIKDFSAKKGNPLIFTLRGPISVIGTLSENKLKNDLIGIKLKDSGLVFSKYPSIGNAYALITPFWMRSFPNSIDNIIIEYKSE